MVNGIRVKVCGITSVKDAEAAQAAGADYLGFILHPQSPRHITLEAFKAMLPKLPPLKKVAVIVFSSPADLARIKDAGFDYFQIHFPGETPAIEVAKWHDIIPPARLWLAPRIRPDKEFDLAFVPLADTFLLDAYHPTKMGGSGKTGDWAAHASLTEKFTKINWVLAGGVNAENIIDAVTASKARFVDVNSGVEASPGVKDHAKLKAFFGALKQIPAPAA